MGVGSVGLIAVPVMITEAAYDLCQALGWKHGLHFAPSEVKRFNAAIAVFTALAMCLNFVGINPACVRVHCARRFNSLPDAESRAVRPAQSRASQPTY